LPEIRRLLPGRLVLASHNAGKLRELRAMLAPRGFEVVSAGELGLAEPAETGRRFEENAAIKALVQLVNPGRNYFVFAAIQQVLHAVQHRDRAIRHLPPLVQTPGAACLADRQHPGLGLVQ
jgi:hypothetical protein